MKQNRRAQRILAAFYGVPQHAIHDPWAGKPPLPADSIMEVLLEKHRIGKPRTEEVIMEHWSHLVGSVAAHRCSPHRIDPAGVLHVVVANPILRRELLFQKRQILARLSSLQGCESIREISFQAG